MAQTAGAMSFRNAVIEISTDNSAWTDISGVASRITTSGSDRQIGQINTATGDNPVVTVGKKSRLEIEAVIVYTEVTTEAYNVLEGYHNGTNAPTQFYMRWAPKGTATGNFRYTTSVGLITEMPPPGGDASSPDPMIVTFKYSCGGYTKAVI